MATAADILKFINTVAPFDSQMSWDNSGLLIGDSDCVAEQIGLCLDITHRTITAAKQCGANVIVSHHPVIFSPLKSVAAGSVQYELIRSGITAICAHTNFDLAAGGVNDMLAGVVGLENVTPLDDGNTLPLGRIGDTDKDYTPENFAGRVKDSLGCGRVRLVPGVTPIKKVAVCGGAGADLLTVAVKNGADALVTGEAKHHELLLADELGITLIDAGHFSTEHPAMYALKSMLEAEFPYICTTVLEEVDPAQYI